MREALIIGKTSLEKYVTEPINIEEERKKKADELIKSFGGPEGTRALEREKLILELLLEQKAKYTYRRLDISFLSAYNPIDYKNQIIKIPKFCVHEFYKDNSFYMNIYTGYCDGLRIMVGINETLPKIFSEKLLKSLEFSEYSDYAYYRSRDGNAIYKFDVPRKILKKYRKLGETEITSEFHGIFPQEAKEKAKEAEEIFRREKLFLISETEQQRIISDGGQRVSLVGIFNENCFLIDNFNTLPTKELFGSKIKQIN